MGEQKMLTGGGRKQGEAQRLTSNFNLQLPEKLSFLPL